MYRDIIRPEKLDRSVSLHGADYIDVPAQGRRDYKLHFHSYKEFSIVAKVHTDADTYVDVVLVRCSSHQNSSPYPPSTGDLSK